MYVCMLNKRHCIKFTIFVYLNIQTILISFPIYTLISNCRLSFFLFFKQMLKFPFLNRIFFSLSKGKNNDLISLHPPLVLLARETFASNETKALDMCTGTQEICVHVYIHTGIYIIYILYLYLYIYMYRWMYKEVNSSDLWFYAGQRFIVNKGISVLLPIAKWHLPIRQGELSSGTEIENSICSW